MHPSISHLYHVNEVVEVLRLVDGQLAVLVDHPVVDDLSRDADTQDVVAGVTDGLPDQEEAVLGRTQLGHCLGAGDFPMEPSAAGTGFFSTFVSDRRYSEERLETRLEYKAKLKTKMIFVFKNENTDQHNKIQ